MKTAELVRDEITVWASPISDEVIVTFTNIEDLQAYAIEHSIAADCVSINGMILLGWDEIDHFTN